MALIAVRRLLPGLSRPDDRHPGVDRKLVEVGRVYELSPLALIRRILLPATLPAYLTGLRGGLGLGWMFVIAAEFMGASRGPGLPADRRPDDRQRRR